jgi:hypothetical protein
MTRLVTLNEVKGAISSRAPFTSFRVTSAVERYRVLSALSAAAGRSGR